MTTPATAPPPGYWVLVAVLMILGALAIFSIGLPFVVLALALAGLSPVYGRPRVFWPLLAAVVGFLAGTVLTVPTWCSTEVATSSADGSIGRTTCETFLGFEYAGDADYQPPHAPALAVGAVTGVAAGLLTRRVLGLRARS